MHASSKTTSVSVRQPIIRPRPLVRDVQFDGTDYAVKFNFSRSWHVAVGEHVSIWNGARRHWGCYRKASHYTSFQSYWRIHAKALDRSLTEFYQRLVTAGLAEGIQPEESLEVFQDYFAAAKASCNKKLFTDGVRIEIFQLENFSSFVRCSYHSGLRTLFGTDLEGSYDSEMQGWWVPSNSAESLGKLLQEHLDFDEEQIVIHPGVFRFDQDDNGLIELSPEEREDFERQLRSRAGIFDGIDLERDFGILEDQSLVPVDDEGADQATKEPNRYFLDITDQLRSADYTEASLQEFMDAAALNLRANLPGFEDYLDVQVQGIKFLIERTSRLLADDMGLGKTVQATVAAGYRAKTAGKKALIVTTKSATDTAWRTTIQAAFPQDRIAVCHWDESADWVVCNYEQLKLIERHAKHFAVMVCDEAHRVNNPISLRTRIAFALAHDIESRYLLTGTPILNNPGDLHTLLRLSGHPLGSIPVKQYLKHMEEDSFKNEAHGLLRREWLLRRMKRDHLNLPPKWRHHPVIKITRKQRSVYDAAFGPARHHIQTLHAAREALAEIKLDWIIKDIKKNARGKKTIIFCEYVKHIEYIQSQLEKMGRRAVVLFGMTKDHERIDAITSFQADPKVTDFIGTTKAAGESITLTSAHRVYFTLCPWTDAALSQAEDRAWRNGVKHEVDVFIPLVEDTIDTRLMEIVRLKGEMAEDLFTALPDDASANMEEVFRRATTTVN